MGRITSSASGHNSSETPRGQGIDTAWQGRLRQDNINQHVVQSHKDREEKADWSGGHERGGGKLQGQSCELIPTREMDNLGGRNRQEHHMGWSVEAAPSKVKFPDQGHIGYPPKPPEPAPLVRNRRDLPALWPPEFQPTTHPLRL